MNYPNFLIIGAQKSGTSWLHHQLRQHPGIFMPPDKDAPFFFNNEQETVNFLKRFKLAPHGSLIGDANASYFWTRNSGPYPDVFNKDISFAIRQYLGDKLKLIVMLKHPVQRSISAYLHHIAHASVSINSTILEAPRELGIVSLSRYRQHLEHWLQDCPSSQLLILPAPDASNTDFILNRVCEFLAIENTGFSPNVHEVIFQGLKRKQRDDGVWAALLECVKTYDARTAELPLMEIDGEKYVRLIQRSEIEILENMLAADSEIYEKTSRVTPPLFG